MFNRSAAMLMCVGAFALLHPALASSADLGTANLSWSPGPDTPQVAVALDKGFWTKRGVTVKTSSTPTGREALEQVIGGQADYALMAELPPVIGAMQHQNFKVIASLSRYTASRIIATSALDLSSLKNLAGKKIGTTQGTNVNFQMYAVLQSAGVSNAQLVSVAPSDVVPALARGDIDAGFMFQSFYPLAKKVLGARYRERRTPEYASTFVLVASTNEIAQHPDRVKAMLSGLIEGDQYVAKNTADAAISVSKAMGGIATPADLQVLWADYSFGIRLDRPLLALFDDEAHWVHNSGFVKGPDPSISLFLSYVDPSFLSAVAPKNVHLK
jgi:NitT/TauT family transport system substrate-binding protein